MSIARRFLTGRHVQLVSRIKSQPLTLNNNCRRAISFTNTKTSNCTAGRFYTSAATNNAQQQASKISSMASSPRVIEAAKAESSRPSKMKELTKKYGAVGIAVYLAVGCVDLGITLSVIQLVGLDKVKAIEKTVLDVLYRTRDKFGLMPQGQTPEAAIEEKAVVKESNIDETPSLASVFILAYGIHKTLLLPVRLGITAAITPAVVRKLHQLGWARYFPGLKSLSKPPRTSISKSK